MTGAVWSCSSVPAIVLTSPSSDTSYALSCENIDFGITCLSKFQFSSHPKQDLSSSWVSSLSRYALEVAPSPLPAYYLQEILSTLGTTILQLWQHKPQNWTFLQAEGGLSMTKSTSVSLLPSGSLYVNPPLMWEWWPKVSSLRQGSLPSSLQGDKRNGRHDSFWGLSLKQKTKLNQRESAILPCVFPANLVPGELTELLLLAHSSSPILSWVLQDFHLTCTPWLPVLTPVNHSMSGSADGHLRFEVLIPLPPSYLQQWLPQRVSCASRNCPVAPRISQALMCYLAFGREQRHPWMCACQLTGSLPRCISVINLLPLSVSFGVSVPHEKRQKG